MSVYIDTPFTVPLDHPKAPRCFLGRQSAHLTADTVEELIDYAESIGMNRAWLQHAGRPSFHFDVTGARLKRVLADSRVQKIGAKDFARLWMARRAAAAQGGAS